MKERLLLILLITITGCQAQKSATGTVPLLNVDVLVVGGGTAGVAAGIQSARLGANTLIIEPTPWLGGMLTAAGVSATDGNHRLPSGIWNEFRQALYKVYGGPKEVETGWVSNTQFEPHVGDSIFQSMVRVEKNLTVKHGYRFSSLTKSEGRITEVTFLSSDGSQRLTVQPEVVIEATELGDVLKHAGEEYDLGMEANSITGENVGVNESNDIIQDLTYVAILKDFGSGDHTIAKPGNFDPSEFDGASTSYYKDTTRKKPGVDAQKMLDYGKLPNGKYMLNWPNYGNDTYLNVVEQSHEQRETAYREAKETTLRFVYFIQSTLGFKHLGLANEFPTSDKLALIPYHRESRRLRGAVRFNMLHIAKPFDYSFYRTGISVGDYPIDHHHKKNAAAPQHLEFYSIPSYNIPLGALIPVTTNNLLVAEKSISVSNVANGTTRLQPVVLLTGQAAGVLAALAVQTNVSVDEVPVRDVQEQLLKAKAYIMPYIDVPPTDPHFEAIQRIGATGLLKGVGIPFKWANQTWFYPDSTVDAKEFQNSWRVYSKDELTIGEGTLSVADVTAALIPLLAPERKMMPISAEEWNRLGLRNYNTQRKITRRELAVVLDKVVNPFHMKAVNHKGEFVKKNL